MNRQIKRWSKEEDQTLLSMRLEGKPYKEISRVLGRSRGSAKARARYLSMTRLHGNESKYLPLFQEDHTLEEVARLMGVKNNTVRRMKWILQKKGYSLKKATRKNRRISP